MPRDNVYYQGEMDELSSYHRALTAAEIQAIFCGGSAGKYNCTHALNIRKL